MPAARAKRAILRYCIVNVEYVDVKTWLLICVLILMNCK